MDFEWDEEKRKKIMSERGIDILDAALIFEKEVLTKEDRRDDYGERRFISMGMVDGECYVVVHAMRNGNIRLITAWKGGRSGRKEYQKRFPG